MPVRGPVDGTITDPIPDQRIGQLVAKARLSLPVWARAA